MHNGFLKISHLKKIFNEKTPGEILALDDVSFSMSRGEFVSIVGSNAAGKTTLFNTIAGSVEQTSGDIIIDGFLLTSVPEYKRSSFISRVQQDPNSGIVLSMTLAENLAVAKLKTIRAGFSLGVTKKLQQEFSKLLAPLGLGLEYRLNDSISLLSGGQKQAVGLLMATILQPKILLLDEHTASLDPNTSEKILQITNDLVLKKGITTLMITHNIHHAIRYGNRLLLFDRGKIAFEASGEEKTRLSVLEVVEKLTNKVAELEEDFKIPKD